MSKAYSITEYGSFVRGKEMPGYTALPLDTFDALENFVLSNSGKDTDAIELMSLSARKGIGKVITAKNYVGVISMENGTTIEILPKIYSKEYVSEAESKKLLVDMLKTLRNFPYKSLQTTNVNTEKISIFEIFIRMFIDEVFSIVKRGLKCSYETVRSNEAVFKGKMNYAGQIRYNYAHKERCYVEFDQFNMNRVENKLIKATLLYLQRHTGSLKNKNDIKTLLNSFLEVDASVDYEMDFAKVVMDRNTKDYTNALMWSRVFLQGKSFTAFSGSEVAFALLFPMETLFESYIATQIRKVLDGAQYSVSAQDKTFHLFDEPGKKFLMKPDIVVKDKIKKHTYIMDTKWKVLSDTKANYGIAQTDMYQMYAYHKKYKAENVTLIYPMTEKITSMSNIYFRSEDKVNIRVKFVDLFDVKNSLSSIVADINSQSDKE